MEKKVRRFGIEVESDIYYPNKRQWDAVWPDFSSTYLAKDRDTTIKVGRIYLPGELLRYTAFYTEWNRFEIAVSPFISPHLLMMVFGEASRLALDLPHHYKPWVLFQSESQEKPIGNKTIPLHDDETKVGLDSFDISVEVTPSEIGLDTTSLPSSRSGAHWDYENELLKLNISNNLLLNFLKSECSSFSQPYVLYRKIKNRSVLHAKFGVRNFPSERVEIDSIGADVWEYVRALVEVLDSQ